MRKSNTICLNCKSLFYARKSAKDIGYGKFCCHECYIKYTYNGDTVYPLKKTCITCKADFMVSARKKNKKFCCQTCAARYNNRNRAGIKYNSEQNLKIRLVRNYGHFCAVCQYSTSLDGHHIVPKYKGGNDDLSNGILLCPNHHREVHLGLIKCSDLIALKHKLDIQ